MFVNDCCLNSTRLPAAIMESNMTCPPPFDITLYNFSEYDYPGPPGTSIPFTWREGLKVVSYVVLFLLALFGNVLVMLVVYVNQHMRTTTNFYLVNLAVADVLIAVCCMWVHLLTNLTYPVFSLGAFMCKMNPFMQTTCLTASVLTLTAISCDRFIAVLFPLRARITQQRARVVITAVWVLAVGVSLPLVIHREYYEVRWRDYVEHQCEEVWSASNSWDATYGQCVTSYPAKKVYYTFFCVALFFLPMTVMTGTYSMLIWRLWMSQLPGERSDAAVMTQARSKKKVVKMVLIVLLVFIFCWMPLQILILYAVYGHTQDQGQLPSWFPDMEYVAYFIAYSNSAANPVIYCGFNANFRKGLLGILRCSLIQDFKSRGQRGKSGKSSTMTTHVGSGRLREAPTCTTGAPEPHELVEKGPPTVILQRPPSDNGETTCFIWNNDHQVPCNATGQRRRSSGDYEEVVLRNPNHVGDHI